MTSDTSDAGQHWHDVCAEDELIPGEMVNVNVGRHSLLLVRDQEGVSALQNVCPHEHCYLHTGELDKGAIVCAGARVALRRPHRRGNQPTAGEPRSLRRAGT